MAVHVIEHAVGRQHAIQKFRPAFFSNGHADWVYPPEIFNHMVSVEYEAPRNQEHQQIKNPFFPLVVSQDETGDDGEKRENGQQVANLLSGGTKT
jgi:hypothetical protein